MIKRRTFLGGAALCAALPLFGGNYALTVGSEIAIFVILQFWLSHQ